MIVQTARWLVAAGVLVGCAAVAHAAPRRGVAYVDEVIVYGGADPEAARSFVARTLQRAGYAAMFPPGIADPCGRDHRCHATRAANAGAAISLRVIVLAVAGDVSVSLLAVDADNGSSWQYREQTVVLGDASPEIATAISSAPFTVKRDRRARRVAAWSFAGTGVAVGIAGVAALLHSRSIRSDFFDEHIDADGNVFGITPEDARATEDRAKRWSLAGWLLVVGAGAAGVTATVLFVGGGDGEVRPAGLAIGGEF